MRNCKECEKHVPRWWHFRNVTNVLEIRMYRRREVWICGVYFFFLCFLSFAPSLSFALEPFPLKFLLLELMPLEALPPLLFTTSPERRSILPSLCCDHCNAGRMASQAHPPATSDCCFSSNLWKSSSTPCGQMRLLPPHFR